MEEDAVLAKGQDALFNASVLKAFYEVMKAWQGSRTKPALQKTVKEVMDQLPIDPATKKTAVVGKYWPPAIATGIELTSSFDAPLMQA